VGVARVERETHGQRQLLESRQLSEGFSFHIQESAQRPGEKIWAEGQIQALGNRLSFPMKSIFSEHWLFRELQRKHEELHLRL
jgi:hypothetical protein